MSLGRFRSWASAQAKMRMLELELDGNLAQPVAAGFDSLQIKEIIKVGVGEYTIILKRPFNLDNVDKAKCFIQPLEANRASWTKAVAHDRVTIQMTDLAGVAADSAISLMIIGTDAKHRQ